MGKKRSGAKPRLGRTERVLRGTIRGVIGWTWWIGLRLGVLGAIVLAAGVAYYVNRLPPLDEMLDGRDRGSVTLLDADDTVFAWRGQQLGLLRAEDASPYLVDAIVATEDKRFYSHFGVDIRGTLRALVVNARAGTTVQGGSSITQQVAKLLFFDNSRTLERKIKEVPAAIALDWKFSKDDILSIYLNRAYLGAGATGFEAAAQRYFGKSAREVGPAEAAMLAGLLRAPSRFAPTHDLNAAQERANVIVGLMEDQGYLSKAQATEARKHPARLSHAAAARAGGEYADWIMQSGPDFLTRRTTEDIEVLTTFDPRIQAAAEAALRSVFENKVRNGSNAQAAIVVMSPDGAVRAMVGGRDLGGSDGQFNRATQALRQTGSLFKTFVYAAALQAGDSPYDTVLDAPLTIDVPGSGPWSPKNYTRDYKGEMTLADAYAHSINTATIRLAEETGRARVRAMARDLGVDSPIAEGPALALGTSEATLLEMTGAYAGILNKGVRATPYGIRELRLKSDHARLMGADSGTPTRVMDERSAGEMVWMMRRVVEEGTGARARLGDRPAAGKTGTTQAARDAWFIGFTRDYVTGVWMGYDNNTPLKGVSGGGLPTEIWRETMLRVEDGLPVRPLPEVEPRAPSAVASLPSPSEVVENVGETVQSVVRNVLGGLFGSN
ncbi:transglycosylase domain-containing protein [Amaricoccus solimangrovi]|uniref:PBP1A family penicillin-binding protein n=1 Tax=Amaricoccus solimangrovi TaxID=2589815 RepID=A0A501WB27_9RHOB|nr:PBP1A family penicillin-binding protein [Amaricoccus solimangrovi]TPE46608.1 PBP1A family penicillin-binding protein [Amaricoccus solimangrovi]